MNRIVLITGVERSGSSIVTRVFEKCGAFGGDVNVMYENKEIRSFLHYLIDSNTEKCEMPRLKNVGDLNNFVLNILKEEGFKGGVPYYKDSGIAVTWNLWNKAFPKAKWVIVRRRTGDIINSCIHTGYMKRFKDESNQKFVGAKNEQEGWLWWVHQYEDRFREILEDACNVQIVWPERMADGDFSQMQEVIRWTGLQWNSEIEKEILPLFKNRK